MSMVYHFALHTSATPARDFGSRWVSKSNMHTSTKPVHRLSRNATRLSCVRTICQWFVTKIAAAIMAAPTTMAIGIPMFAICAESPEIATPVNPCQIKLTQPCRIGTFHERERKRNCRKGAMPFRLTARQAHALSARGACISHCEAQRANIPPLPYPA
jgi:hypothetical protein